MNITQNNQEIELEAKNLLTQKQFQALKDFFKIGPGSFDQQLNKYFMDAGDLIKNSLPAGTTLRVRTKKGGDMVEFKLPKPDGSVAEYKTPLNENEYEKLFGDGILPDGDVKHTLSLMQIDEPFTFLGIADTLRSKAKINNTWDAEILLDETHYPGGKVDYEIEVESDTLSYSQKVLEEVLAVIKAPLVPTPRKIERFYEAIGL